MKQALNALLLAGPTIADLLHASERFHRLLAEPPRARKPQMQLSPPERILNRV